MYVCQPLACNILHNELRLLRGGGANRVCLKKGDPHPPNPHPPQPPTPVLDGFERKPEGRYFRGFPRCLFESQVLFRLVLLMHHRERAKARLQSALRPGA